VSSVSSVSGPYGVAGVAGVSGEAGGPGEAGVSGVPSVAGEPKISIIVPVYQVEDYLAECLDSLLAQSFANIEVVCVNDGSTDGSAAILAAYAERDGRIAVVKKTNGGLSSARNAGIAAANAELLMFVDSDDLLEPDACATVAEAFARTGAELLVFGATAFPVAASNRWLDAVLSPRNAVYRQLQEQQPDGRDKIRFDPALLFVEKSTPFVWRTAVTAAFLKRTGLSFDETLAFGEDQVFQFLAYPQAYVVALCANKLYRYRVRRPQSLMAARHASELCRLQDHVEIVRRIFAGWNALELLPKYAPELTEWLLDFMLWDIYRLPDAKQSSLLHELGAILNTHFSHAEMCRLPLSAATRQILLLMMSAEQSDDGENIRVSGLLMGRYFFEQRGILKTIAGTVKYLYTKIRIKS
jgi:glycosyltransferase involved in cell wall biosynthesis